VKTAGVFLALGAVAAAGVAGVVLVQRAATSTSSDTDETSTSSTHELPAGLSRWVYHRERSAGVDDRLLQLLAWWDDNGPWPVVIPEHGGLRTSEQEQQDLFARGVTKASTLAQTPHGRGGALDLAPYRKGPGGLYAPDYSQPDDFTAIGEAAEALGLSWGGRWSDPDLPHVEVPDWRSLPLGGVA
jgi:hypothetical protein